MQYINAAMFSMIMTAIIAGIVVIPAYLFIFRNRIKEWWKRKHDK